MRRRIRVKRRDRADRATYGIGITGRELVTRWDRLTVGEMTPVVDSFRGELLIVTKRAGTVHDAELFAPIDLEWHLEEHELRDGLAAAYDFEQLLLALPGGAR